MFIGEMELFFEGNLPSGDFSSMFTSLGYFLLKNCFFFFLRYRVIATIRFSNLK